MKDFIIDLQKAQTVNGSFHDNIT